MRYSVAEPDFDRLKLVIPTMRQADVEEAWAATHHSPEEAVEYSLRASRDAWMGLAGQEIICVFGVGEWSALSSRGVPWMLGFEGLEYHARGFLRHSITCVDHMKDKYDRLDNYVDERNTKSVQWLRWLGFTIGPAEPFGIEQLPFHHFYWRAE